MHNPFLMQVSKSLRNILHDSNNSDAVILFIADNFVQIAPLAVLKNEAEIVAAIFFVVKVIQHADNMVISQVEAKLHLAGEIIGLPC
jgi:predicted glycosyltransferase involved in capsule biosynthesis